MRVVPKGRHKCFYAVLSRDTTLKNRSMGWSERLFEPHEMDKAERLADEMRDAYTEVNIVRVPIPRKGWR